MHSALTLMQPIQKSLSLHVAIALSILLAGLRFYNHTPNPNPQMTIEFAARYSNEIKPSIQQHVIAKSVTAPITDQKDRTENPSMAAATPQSQATNLLVSEMANYLASVRQEIEKRKYYPLIARTRKTEGHNIIGFTIDPSGKITNLKLTKTSGSDVLDRATLDLLQDIGQFSPIPNNTTGDSLTLFVPVSYQLTQ